MILFKIPIIISTEKVWTRAWLLHLLGAYAFFGTGNQQTLSSIPWRAAFVALPGNFPYKWLPALLVLSSMFAGGVVASLMVLRDETGGMAPLYFMLFGGLKVFKLQSLGNLGEKSNHRTLCKCNQ